MKIKNIKNNAAELLETNEAIDVRAKDRSFRLILGLVVPGFAQWLHWLTTRTRELRCTGCIAFSRAVGFLLAAAFLFGTETATAQSKALSLTWKGYADTEAAAGKKSDIDWIPSFDRASELAQRTGKPLLLEFWASWCGPCKQMDQESWPDERVVKLSKNFVCVSVDADRDQDAGAHFVVKSLPTVILADPWGRPLTRREGYLHSSDLAGSMAEVPADFTPAKGILEELARDANNGLLLARMGQFYLQARALRFSSQYYNEALKSKECKSDAELRCELHIAIAMNDLTMRNWSDARKRLRQLLRDFPESSQRDRVLLGLVVADLRQGKRADAEKSLAELKKEFPLSQATQSAARMIEESTSAK